MELELTLDNFDAAISESTPIIVDFWASWCGPCRMLAGTVEQVANESDGSYKVMSIPTLIVFKNGEIVNQSVGVIPKGKMLEMLK